ncbi:MAG TPA: hypothetical protein ENK74_00560, partial [Nitratifractor sp.]|nr:hypothetical protein [Nitratifractor sp.]
MRLLFIIIVLIGALFAKERVFVKFSSTKLYLNEPTLAKVVVKSDKKPRYITVDGFKEKTLYFKLLKESNITQDGAEYTKIFYYALFPQATGSIKIDKVLARVSSIQEKTGFTISDTLESKPYSLEVAALPDGLTICGNLTMELTQSSQSVKENEPVNFTLRIKGNANIDDIKPFNPTVEGATIYKRKPQREYKIVDGKLQAEFTQLFTVVAQESFRLEPLTLRYFNTQTKMKEVLGTKPVEVKIDKKLFTLREILFLIVGILIGVAVALLFFKRRGKKRVPSSLDIAIQKAKDDKELYRVLLPYAYDARFAKSIKLLEENIYKGAKH